MTYIDYDKLQKDNIIADVKWLCTLAKRSGADKTIIEDATLSVVQYIERMFEKNRKEES